MESQGKTAEVLDALLKGEKVVVEDGGRFGELEQVGYGEREGKKLVLKDYEALYLLFSGRLNLKDDRGRKVSFNQLARGEPGAGGGRLDQVHHLQGPEVEGLHREGRVRLRDGPRSREELPEKAAKFVVFALDEGTEREVEELSDSVRQIVKMGKEAIVAVIERRGEVIYYKVGRANFHK